MTYITNTVLTRRRPRRNQNGGLTGEFAALGSLFTAGYLFLLIL